MAKENRINTLRDMITSSQQGYDKYSPIFRSMLDMYLLRLDSKTLDSLQRRGKSHLYFPVVNAKIKRITNSFQEAYFSTDTFSKLIEVDEEDGKKTESLQEAVDYYTKRAKLFETMQEVFMYAPMLGTTFLKSYWANGKVNIEYKPLHTVRVDPSARTWEDVRYIVEDIYLTRDDIKRYQRQGIFKRDFKVDQLQSTDDRGNTDKFERIKLQEVYCTNGLGGWTVSTIYDESIALRIDKKLEDGHPFTRGILIPQAEEIDDTTAVMTYGEPAVSAISSLQAEVNIRRNQQIDAIKRLLDPKLIIDQNSGINPADIAHPTKPIMANKAGGNIDIVPPPNIQASIFDVQEIDNDISENIGVSPQQNGVAPNRKMTATESSIVSNEGNMRLQSYIRSLNETLIEPTMERIARLVWKYGDARFFVGIDRTEDFEFVANVNTGLGATNKEIQMNGLQQSFQAVSQLHQMSMASQDMETMTECVTVARNIVKELLPLNGIKDAESYFKDKENGLERQGYGVFDTRGAGGVPNQADPISNGGIGTEQGMEYYPQ